MAIKLYEPMLWWCFIPEHTRERRGHTTGEGGREGCRGHRIRENLERRKELRKTREKGRLWRKLKGKKKLVEAEESEGRLKKRG